VITSKLRVRLGAHFAPIISREDGGVALQALTVADRQESKATSTATSRLCCAAPSEPGKPIPSGAESRLQLYRPASERRRLSLISERSKVRVGSHHRRTSCAEPAYHRIDGKNIQVDLVEEVVSVLPNLELRVFRPTLASSPGQRLSGQQSDRASRPGFVVDAQPRHPVLYRLPNLLHRGDTMLGFSLPPSYAAEMLRLLHPFTAERIFGMPDTAAFSAASVSINSRTFLVICSSMSGAFRISTG